MRAWIERYKAIREIYARLGSIAGTAREADCDRATVRTALGRPRVVRRAPKARRPGKLTPFLPMLQRLVVDDNLTAVLAYEELQNAGFTGRYSIVKKAVRKTTRVVKQAKKAVKKAVKKATKAVKKATRKAAPKSRGRR